MLESSERNGAAKISMECQWVVQVMSQSTYRDSTHTHTHTHTHKRESMLHHLHIWSSHRKKGLERTGHGKLGIVNEPKEAQLVKIVL